jgi:3-oxoacyl-[acyl-carrier-protein] synthase III
MRSFVVNRNGRLVFPSNLFVDLDFSVFETLDQFSAVIRRDFEAKAPTGTDILSRVEAGAYSTRYELLRDLALNLFWANRYAITMYDKRPTRWRDVPRHRDDVFLPVLTPWQDGDRKVAAVEAAYRTLPPTWDALVEDKIFAILFDVFGNKKHHATELSAIKPTVEEILADPDHKTFRLGSHDADFPIYGYDEIIDSSVEAPGLESLLRSAMVLHNQYPWDRRQTSLGRVRDLRDDDFVVLFVPRDREVLEFIRRVKAADASGRRVDASSAGPPIEASPPTAPFPPIEVRKQFAILPHLESLAVVKGEQPCTNDDLIRNAAYNWSPMTAAEILEKTGIEVRRYTGRDLEDLALEASLAALDHAGREAAEIGAVLVCSCTSTRLIPSIATWLSGQLGMLQTHVSCDLVAACAGLSYGLAEAVRLIQEVRRPVLLVCAEKFSDKIGSVRTSRMIFGDGAAALVIGPAADGAGADIEVLQTYASGPVSEVNSIIWPNPDFDNNITVYGPQVRALVRRYLTQMIGELQTLRDPDAPSRSMLESIDLVVPHQANKTMVTTLTSEAGLRPESLYFNIERVGNASAASIPLAIFDAVREGVIDRAMRVFTPGFGAGAVGGYAVLRVDPAIIATETVPVDERHAVGHLGDAGPTSDDIREAFAS